MSALLRNGNYRNNVLLYAKDIMQESSNLVHTEYVDFESKNRKVSVVSFRNLLIFLATLTISVSVIIGVLYFFAPRLRQEENLLSFQLQQPQNDLRLPDDVHPVHYRLRIYPNLDNFTYRGRVSIHIECTKSTDRIVLHMHSLNLHNATLRDVVPGKGNLIRDIDRSENSRLYLTLGDLLVVGKVYFLDAEFSGNITDEMVGFYRSGYKNERGEKRWLATTHLQPNHARRVFPCFDEPNLKATFAVTIARKTGQTALSNMPLRETEAFLERPGWVLDHFESTPPMSTYLVAFTIGDLESMKVPSPRAGASIRIWAPKHLLHATKYAASVTSDILAFYEEYFGLKYSLPKLDLVVIPEFAKGAMENWGLISFRDSSILVHDEDGNEEVLSHVFYTVAHELAHQWFGNLVTMEWWSDLWLNEGFATYMGYLAQAQLRPQWKSQQKFAVDVIHKALRADSSRMSHSLHAEVVSESDLEQIFDPIMYDKGACLLRMLRGVVGEERFRSGIVAYIKKWSFNSTTESDLWDSFPSTANLSVSSLMKPWTEKSGYPVLSISKRFNSITVTQEKFGDKTDEEAWTVPVSITNSQNGRIAQLLVNTRSVTAQIEVGRSAWILANINQTGFYRVNYEEENWLKLIAQLKHDHKNISVETRAQLIDDSFNLAKAGYLDYRIPFELISYLSTFEEDDVPWQAALGNLNWIEDVLTDTEYFEGYREYMRRLLSKQQSTTLDLILSNERKAINRVDLLLLSKSCSLRFRQCAELARGYLDGIKNGTMKNFIPLQVQYELLCAAISTGTDQDWEFVWNKTLNRNTSPAQQMTYYLSLGCTRDTWKINSYLKKSYDGSIAPQNVKFVWRSLSKRAEGRLVGLKFLESNWSKVYNATGDKYNLVEAVVGEFLGSLSGKSDLQRVSNFFWTYTDNFKPVSVLVKGAIEEIENKVMWLEWHGSKVAAILNGKVL